MIVLNHFINVLLDFLSDGCVSVYDGSKDLRTMKRGPKFCRNRGVNDIELRYKSIIYLLTVT